MDQKPWIDEIKGKGSFPDISYGYSIRSGGGGFLPRQHKHLRKNPRKNTTIDDNKNETLIYEDRIKVVKI